nr:MAG TPA: hypothetical protein [Caudoviricetes sp.]
MFLSDLPRARLDFLKLKRAFPRFALCVCRFQTVADAASFVAEKASVSVSVARVALVAVDFGRVRVCGGAGMCAPAGIYTRAHACRHTVTHSHKYIYVFDLFMFLCVSRICGACGVGSLGGI